MINLKEINLLHQLLHHFHCDIKIINCLNLKHFTLFNLRKTQIIESDIFDESITIFTIRYSWYSLNNIHYIYVPLKIQLPYFNGLWLLRLFLFWLNTLNFLILLNLSSVLIKPLTHSFPMHPFSTPSCFPGVEKGCIGDKRVNLHQEPNTNHTNASLISCMWWSLACDGLLHVLVGDTKNKFIKIKLF